MNVLSGNRVQWFRAEAEMETWRDQVEQRLADLQTTSCSFAETARAWTNIVPLLDTSQIGHIAYAKKQAARFVIRENAARSALRSHEIWRHLADDEGDLVAFVQGERGKHEAMFAEVLVAGLEKVKLVTGVKGDGEADADQDDDDEDEEDEEDEEKEDEEEEKEDDEEEYEDEEEDVEMA
jgi:TATA-binding protein-associated factor Taf7